MSDVNANVPNWDKALTEGYVLPREEVARNIPQGGRELLMRWSNVTEDELVDHVVRIQREGYAVCPYPCIGKVRFLGLHVRDSPEYPAILQRLKDGQTLADLGCGVGQDIRQLALDGAPTRNVTGFDVETQFFELGYELFRDRGRLEAQFQQLDIFDRAHKILQDRSGTYDMLLAMNFFHLWNRERQFAAMRQVAALMRPCSGSTLYGTQLAAMEPYEAIIISESETSWCHSPASLQGDWDRIGSELGLSFKVDTSLDVVEAPFTNVASLQDARLRIMTFKITVQ